MGIAENYRQIAQVVSTYPRAKLVAVVKQRSVKEIRQLILTGATDIAFNTLQEAEDKLPALGFLGSTHFIGHLQDNKVRKVIARFDIIESVDSLALANRIDRIAGEEAKTVAILLQVNIADDPAKYGLPKTAAMQVVSEVSKLRHLRLLGLMTIGKLVATDQEKTLYFRETKALFDHIRTAGIGGADFTELSMGMSEDYELALREGATIVRVGSALFEKTCETA